VEAVKKLLTDLETLNQQLATRLNGRNTQFLFTGDLLSGKQHCRMGDLVDCLYNCWRNDSVHGDKSAYLKLAMALLDFLEPKMDPNYPRLPGRKRRRPASPGSDSGASPVEQLRGQRGQRTAIPIPVRLLVLPRGLPPPRRQQRRPPLLSGPPSAEVKTSSHQWISDSANFFSLFSFV
jgi:hypothetical protein